jgi:hypothetical protein
MVSADANRWIGRSARNSRRAKPRSPGPVRVPLAFVEERRTVSQKMPNLVIRETSVARRRLANGLGSAAACRTGVDGGQVPGAVRSGSWSGPGAVPRSEAADSAEDRGRVALRRFVSKHRCCSSNHRRVVRSGDTVFRSPDEMFCTPDEMFRTPDEMFCAPDEVFCTHDDVVCTQDAAVCTHDDVICTQHATACTPDAAVCTHDSAACTHDAAFRTIDAVRLKKTSARNTDLATFRCSQALRRTASAAMLLNHLIAYLREIWSRNLCSKGIHPLTLHKTGPRFVSGKSTMCRTPVSSLREGARVTQNGTGNLIGPGPV